MMNVANTKLPVIDPAKVRECHSVGFGRSMLACRIHPSGRYVVAGGMMLDLVQYEVPFENGAFAWAKKGTSLRVAGQKSWICSLVFSADGKRLFTTDYAGRVQA